MSPSLIHPLLSCHFCPVAPSFLLTSCRTQLTPFWGGPLFSARTQLAYLLRLHLDKLHVPSSFIVFVVLFCFVQFAWFCNGQNPLHIILNSHLKEKSQWAPTNAGEAGDVGLIPWRKQWQPTPVFLPGEFHGQKSLADYSPWGCMPLVRA